MEVYMEEERQIAGICWFQPEQWDRLIDISEDRDELDNSYSDWRKNAFSAVQEIESTGVIAKKVKINLEELLLWCNEKSVPVNGESRAEYAAHLLCQKGNQT